METQLMEEIQLANNHIRKAHKVAKIKIIIIIIKNKEMLFLLL